METEKVVKKTRYTVLGTKDGSLVVRAHIGEYINHGIDITFTCLEIEWEHDFDFIVKRAKNMLKDFTNDRWI